MRKCTLYALLELPPSISWRPQAQACLPKGLDKRTAIPFPRSHRGAFQPLSEKSKQPGGLLRLAQSIHPRVHRWVLRYILIAILETNRSNYQSRWIAQYRLSGAVARLG